MIIKRDIYLNKLINKRFNSLIKVITGIRRSGKSFLLFTIFKGYLLTNGVPSDHIIEVTLDSATNSHLLDKVKLVNYIKEQIIDDKQYYVFIDEIQNVKDFDLSLNELLRINNVDLYVTGSNSKWLSSDILTSLRGRTDEIHVYPLTFKEYIQVSNDINKAWEEYWKYGGLPLVACMNDKAEKDQYLNNLFKITYLKDILERHSIRNINIFNNLIEVLCSNIGCFTNPTKLSNTIKSITNQSIKSSTISKYISYLENAFIINKASRYDIKGKKYINALEKYYFEDVGIKNVHLKHRQDEKTHIFENIVFNHLLANGYLVDVGLVSKRTSNQKEWLEIDFVANKRDKTYYIQFCLSFEGQNPSKIKERELRSLKQINEGFEKICIVSDISGSFINEQGIKIIGLKEFLLNFN